MALVNQSKPTTSLLNSDKISSGETWGSIPTTWASETRTWLATGSLFTNSTKVSASITNSSKPS